MDKWKHLFGLLKRNEEIKNLALRCAVHDLNKEGVSDIQTTDINHEIYFKIRDCETSKEIIDMVKEWSLNCNFIEQEL